MDYDCLLQNYIDDRSLLWIVELLSEQLDQYYSNLFINHLIMTSQLQVVAFDNDKNLQSLLISIFCKFKIVCIPSVKHGIIQFLSENEKRIQENTQFLDYYDAIFNSNASLINYQNPINFLVQLLKQDQDSHVRILLSIKKLYFLTHDFNYIKQLLIQFSSFLSNAQEEILNMITDIIQQLTDLQEQLMQEGLIRFLFETQNQLSQTQNDALIVVIVQIQQYLFEKTKLSRYSSDLLLDLINTTLKNRTFFPYLEGQVQNNSDISAACQEKVIEFIIQESASEYQDHALTIFSILIQSARDKYVIIENTLLNFQQTIPSNFVLLIDEYYQFCNEQTIQSAIKILKNCSVQQNTIIFLKILHRLIYNQKFVGTVLREILSIFRNLRLYCQQIQFLIMLIVKKAMRKQQFTDDEKGLILQFIIQNEQFIAKEIFMQLSIQIVYGINESLDDLAGCMQRNWKNYETNQDIILNLKCLGIYLKYRSIRKIDLLLIGMIIEQQSSISMFQIAEIVNQQLLQYWSNSSKRQYLEEDAQCKDISIIGLKLFLVLSPYNLPNEIKFGLFNSQCNASQQFNIKCLVFHIMKMQQYLLLPSENVIKSGLLLPHLLFCPEQNIYTLSSINGQFNGAISSSILITIDNFFANFVFLKPKFSSKVLDFQQVQSNSNFISIQHENNCLKIDFLQLSFKININKYELINLKIIIQQSDIDIEAASAIQYEQYYNEEIHKYMDIISATCYCISILINDEKAVNQYIIFPHQMVVLIQDPQLQLYKNVSYSTFKLQSNNHNILTLNRQGLRIFNQYFLPNIQQYVLLNLSSSQLQQFNQNDIVQKLYANQQYQNEKSSKYFVNGKQQIVSTGIQLAYQGFFYSSDKGSGNIIFYTNKLPTKQQYQYSYIVKLFTNCNSQKIEEYKINYREFISGFGIINNIFYFSVLIKQIQHDTIYDLTFNLQYLNAILDISPKLYRSFVESRDFMHILRFIEKVEDKSIITNEVIIQILKLAGINFTYSVQLDQFVFSSINANRLNSMQSISELLQSNLWELDELQYIFYNLLDTLIQNEHSLCFLNRIEFYQLLLGQVIMFAPKAKKRDVLFKCVKNISYCFLVYYIGSKNQFFENSTFSEIFNVAVIYNQTFGSCYKLYHLMDLHLVLNIFNSLIGEYLFQFDQYLQQEPRVDLSLSKQAFFMAQVEQQPLLFLLQETQDNEIKDFVINILHIVFSCQQLFNMFDYENELDPKLYSLKFMLLQNHEKIQIENCLFDIQLSNAQNKTLSSNRYKEEVFDVNNNLLTNKGSILNYSCYYKVVRENIINGDFSNLLAALTTINELTKTRKINTNISNKIAILCFQTFINQFLPTKIPDMQLYDIANLNIHSYFNSSYYSNCEYYQLLQLLFSMLLSSTRNQQLKLVLSQLFQYEHIGIVEADFQNDKVTFSELLFSFIIRADCQLEIKLFLLQIFFQIIMAFITSLEKNEENNIVIQNLINSMRNCLFLLNLLNYQIRFQYNKNTINEQMGSIFLLKVVYFFSLQLFAQFQASLRFNILSLKELPTYYYPPIDIIVNEEITNLELSSYLTYNLLEVFGILCDPQIYFMELAEYCMYDKCKCQGNYNGRLFSSKLSNIQFTDQFCKFIQQSIAIFNCIQYQSSISRQYQIVHFYINCIQIMIFSENQHQKFDIQPIIMIIVNQFLFSQSKQQIQSTSLIDAFRKMDQFGYLQNLRLDLKQLQIQISLESSQTSNIEYMNIYQQVIQTFQEQFDEISKSEAIIAFQNQQQQQSYQTYHLQYQYNKLPNHMHKINNYKFYMNQIQQKLQNYDTKLSQSYDLEMIFKSLVAKQIIEDFQINLNITSNTSSIYSRLSRNEVRIKDGAILHQSKSFNGQAYQRTIPFFLNIEQPTLDITPLIMQLFEYFETLSISCFNVILLNPICNRLSKLYFFQDYLYILSDTPKNQFFMDSVQEFGEFAQVIQQAVDGVMQLQKRQQDCKVQLNSFEFNNISISRIDFNKIITIIERDYGGMNSAVDINLSNGQIIDFVFPSNNNCKEFIKQIISRQPRMLRMVTSIASNNSRLIQISESNKVLASSFSKTPINKYLSLLIKQWQAHQFKTFQFLTELNIFANRSYADVSQYPIFPLLFGCDCKNGKLQTRVLQLPIICQSVERLKNQLQKLQDAMAFGEQQKQLSSVHFAHIAVPPTYMIRIEPWLSCHIMLQQGKIDQADRLFRSIQIMYKNAISNEQNCDESVPEMFYDSSLLYNVNNVPFGKTQNGASVNDVQLPTNFHQGQDYCNFNLALLESDQLHQGINDWIHFMYSDKNSSIDVQDLCSSLNISSHGFSDEINFYPSITQYHIFKQAEVATSLQYYQQQNNEPTIASTIMKLINFGRQPKEIFAFPKILKYSEYSNNGFSNYAEELFESADLQPSLQKEQQVQQLQIAQQMETSFLVDCNVEHFTRSFDSMQAGFLFGRREQFGNMQTRSNSGINYRDDGMQITYLPPIFTSGQYNEQNSITFANNYFLPEGFKYIQNCSGDYVCYYENGAINIFQLPEFILVQIIETDNANDVTPAHALQAWNKASNEFLICRDYGVLDILGYDFNANQIVYLQNLAISNKSLLKCYYNHAWGVCVILCADELVVVNLVHYQVWFRIQISEACKNVIIFDTYPILVACFEKHSRVFDIREAKEHGVLCYVPQRFHENSLLGIFDNKVFIVHNFYEQAQKDEYAITWLGATAGGPLHAVMKSRDTYFISVQNGRKYYLCQFQ